MKMIPEELDQELLAAAFHEAAHAVMCLILGVPLRYVTLGDYGADAEAVIGKTGDVNYLALVGLAGAVVERRILGDADYRPLMSREDRALVIQAADRQGFDRHRYETEMAGVADRMMCRPDASRAIAAVAKALMERSKLDHQEVKRLVGRYVPKG